MKVVGLDLSLTGTGVASRGHTQLVRVRSSGYQRLRDIRDTCVAVTEGADVVVVEGPAYHAQGSSIHQIAGLWWFVTEAVESQVSRLLVAPPSNIKKFATGTGNAQKDRVLMAAARRFPWFDGDNNEADALWACALAHEFLDDPIVEVPEVNKTALKNLEW